MPTDQSDPGNSSARASLSGDSDSGCHADKQLKLSRAVMLGRKAGITCFIAHAETKLKRGRQAWFCMSAITAQGRPARGLGVQVILGYTVNSVPA